MNIWPFLLENARPLIALAVFSALTYLGLWLYDYNHGGRDDH